MNENQTNEPFRERNDFTEIREKLDLIKREVGKVIVGQEEMVELLLAAVLAKGHVLIEGVPGLAKTLTAKLLARTIKVPFTRIQFTPDLMPSDILGTSVFNFKTSDFEFRKGPMFSNIILIDEINRSPAKTQSALFEVMEERQISIEGRQFPMAEPFMIVGTQNPIDLEGTYALPEAQMDRFLFRIRVEYPSESEETQMLLNAHEAQADRQEARVSPVVTGEDIVRFQHALHMVHVEPHLFSFIVQLVRRSRAHPDILLGASPRASLSLLAGAKAIGLLRGRDFITPDDIITVAPPVIGHRMTLSVEKEMEGALPETVVREILHQIEIPK